MSAEHTLARGRAAAERLMVDTCTIRRKVGEYTDPFSGVVTPIYETLYAGKCRVQGVGSATATEAGEAFRLLLRLELHVPMSVVGVKVADEVHIDASALDPDLVGRTFRVRDLFFKTHATARRLGIQEAT